MSLFDRLLDAKETLAPVQSKYRVVFEDPLYPEAPACILVPDPNFMACALAGGILPPVEAYLIDRAVEEEFTRHNPGEVFRWAEHGGAVHAMHEPIGPMTEEEAIEYLVKKDIHPRIWRDYSGNRIILRIVPVELIPSDRTYRNAWRVSQDPQANQEAA